MNKRLIICLVLLSIALCPLTLGKISPYTNTFLILAGIYIILAISLDLLVGFTGLISVGHAAFFAIGAYTSAILTTKYQMPPLIALICGLITSGLVAWAIGVAVLRLKGYYLAMATLGLNAIVVKLITGFSSVTGGASGFLGIPPFSIFGISLENHFYYYYFVWAMVVLIIVCSLAIIKSPFGRALTAIHSDEAAASTLGIDCPRYKLHIFIISGIFAGLAGSLFCHYMCFLAPSDFDISTSIFLLVMLFLGGVGTIYGAALGAAFLKLLPEITYQFRDFELFTYGLILIIVIIFLPRGIFGVFSDINRLLTRRNFQ